MLLVLLYHPIYKNYNQPNYAQTFYYYLHLNNYILEHLLLFFQLTLQHVQVYLGHHDGYNQLIQEWPVLANIKFNLYPDKEFTSEKTGQGSIEYISPDEGEYIPYPNGFKYKNPYKGEASIVYNPEINDYEDIKMDLLHALRVQDPKYKELIKSLDEIVLNGDDDLSRNAKDRYDEDFKKNGKEYMPFRRYVENEVDGLLRNLFYNADSETLKKKDYHPNKEELREWNKHLIPYIQKIEEYLISKKANGGVISKESILEELNNLSPEKFEELGKFLKYLNYD